MNQEEYETVMHNIATAALALSTCDMRAALNVARREKDEEAICALQAAMSLHDYGKETRARVAAVLEPSIPEYVEDVARGVIERPSSQLRIFREANYYDFNSSFPFAMTKLEPKLEPKFCACGTVNNAGASWCDSCGAHL